MIRQIERDDKVFEIPERGWDRNIYFEGVVNGVRYAVSHIQVIWDIAYIHLKVFIWTKEIFREMEDDFGRIREVLKRDYGVKVISVGIQRDNPDRKKLEKFLMFFGFPKMKEYLLGEDRFNLTFLEV